MDVGVKDFMTFLRKGKENKFIVTAFRELVASQVDNNGDYVTEDTSITNTTDGYISCDNYLCTARYNSKNYTRNCK